MQFIKLGKSMIVQIVSFSFSFIGLGIVINSIINIRPIKSVKRMRAELSHETAMDFIRSTVRK